MQHAPQLLGFVAHHVDVGLIERALRDLLGKGLRVCAEATLTVGGLDFSNVAAQPQPVRFPRRGDRLGTVNEQANGGLYASPPDLLRTAANRRFNVS
jgi:hypothetical protein